MTQISGTAHNLLMLYDKSYFLLLSLVARFQRSPTFYVTFLYVAAHLILLDEGRKLSLFCTFWTLRMEQEACIEITLQVNTFYQYSREIRFCT